MLPSGSVRVRCPKAFGTKVSVATTTTGGFVLGLRALPGNPYDGHSLREVLEQDLSEARV